MNKLMSFEGLRMFNTKRALFLVIAYFVTGLSGVLIGSIYTDQGMTNIDVFLFIISAFNQFVFIFISYFYIVSVTNDFEHHIFFMYHQYGIPPKKAMASKILLNFMVSLVSAFLFVGASFFLLGLKDNHVLFSSLVEVALAVLFSVLFASMIAFLCRKTMLAFIVNFIGFILFNVGNLAFRGMLSPADVNGLPFAAIRIIASRPNGRDLEWMNTLTILQTKPFLVLLMSGCASCLIAFLLLAIVINKKKVASIS